MNREAVLRVADELERVVPELTGTTDLDVLDWITKQAAELRAAVAAAPEPVVWIDPEQLEQLLSKKCSGVMVGAVKDVTHYSRSLPLYR